MDCLDLSSILLGNPPRLEWETLIAGLAAVIGAYIIYSKQENQNQYHINNNWKTRGEELFKKLAFAEMLLNLARQTHQSTKFDDFASQLLGLKFQLQPLLDLNPDTLTHFSIALPYVQIKLRANTMINLIESCIGNDLQFDLKNQNHQKFLDGFEPLAGIMSNDLNATQQMMRKKLSLHIEAVKKFEK